MRKNIMTTKKNVLDKNGAKRLT